MSYKRPSLNLASLLLGSMIIFSSTVSQAGKDGVSGGGLITKQGDLLDFAEAIDGAGLVPFIPSNYKQLSVKMNEIINRVLDGDVSFGRRLSQTIYAGRKTWYFKNTVLSDELPTKNLHILRDDKTHEVIAKQDRTKIIVYKPWFDSKVNGSQADQLRAIGLLVHEAIMDTVLEFGMDHNVVREMTRVIFANELGGEFPRYNFLQILKDNGFYPTIAQDKQLQADHMLNKISELEKVLASGDLQKLMDLNRYYNKVLKFNLKELDNSMIGVFSQLAIIMDELDRQVGPPIAQRLEAIKAFLKEYPKQFQN